MTTGKREYNMLHITWNKLILLWDEAEVVGYEWGSDPRGRIEVQNVYLYNAIPMRARETTLKKPKNYTIICGLVRKWKNGRSYTGIDVYNVNEKTPVEEYETKLLIDYGYKIVCIPKAQILSYVW